MINTFNVTLRTCWEQHWPPHSQHSRAAQLSLQLLLQPNTICSVPRGNVTPSCGGLLPQQLLAPPALLLPHLATGFCPWNHCGSPDSLQGTAELHRAPPLTLKFSHLRKRSSSASTSLSERGVLRQGGAGDSVPKPHHELICCDLRAKDQGTKHSYFRGTQGNSII